MRAFIRKAIKVMIIVAANERIRRGIGRNISSIL